MYVLIVLAFFEKFVRNSVRFSVFFGVGGKSRVFKNLVFGVEHAEFYVENHLSFGRSVKCVEL